MPGSGSSSSYRLALPVAFQLEEYRILKVLGQGGFGITYLAYDTRLEIEVAIKEMLPRDYATRITNFEIIPKSQSDQPRFAWSKQRFIEEARVLARLSHVNIVRVFRFLEHHGTACMVMEFVRGQNFLEWMQRHRKPTQQELSSVLLPLLDGLGYLHNEGLLHRDISPENIFITEQGRPILLDFGSARITVGRDRISTSVVRPGYSPIEQYQTVEPQGPFTDLYALAGVMIHAITGQVPPLSMDRLGSRDPFEPLRQRYHGRYRENFLKALDSAFAVRPKDRLRSAAEWRRILARDFRGPQPKPEQTRPPPPDNKVNRTSNAKRKASASPSKAKSPLRLFVLALMALVAAGAGLYFSQINRPEPTPQPLPRETPQPTQLTPPAIQLPIPQAVTLQNATRSHPYANALGMEFVPVPDTMVLFCVHQTRKRDYAAYARAPHENPVDDKWENPEWRNVRVSGQDDHPVVMVNWYDANAFCEWLSEMESKEKGYSVTYRLPTNEEWNAAVGPARFPWGDAWPPPSSGLGNYWDGTAATTFGPDVINIKPIPGYEDGFATTSPVKSFPPNRFGLYDLGSNVQEWCREKLDNGTVRRRGASWKDSTEDAVSPLNQQLFSPPEQRSVFIGFRCVLERPAGAANK